MSLFPTHTINSFLSITFCFFDKTLLNPMNPVPEESSATYSDGRALPFPLRANFIFRIYSSFEAFRRREYWLIASNVASLTSLYWMGPQASAAVDCASETVFLYIALKKKGFFDKFEKDELDCTIRTNALKVLQLTDSEAADDAIVQRKYEDLSKNWQGRIDDPLCTPYLKRQFTLLLRRTETSYRTIKSHKN